jgi:ubiquinone/menaquinone biosynthesis C-methylase UbiE
VTGRPEPAYGRHDQFLDTAGIDSAHARELADRLEALHGSDQEHAHRSAYLDLLAVEPGKHVLEVGCGNGWVLREVARRVGATGRAVGIDPSPELLAIAKDQAAHEQLPVELHPASVAALPFATGAFDTVLVPLVLLHVPEAEAVLPEVIRVVHPGGNVGVWERDNESFVINHPDRALTRRIIQAGTDNTAVNAWVGRRLPGLLAAAGLVEVQIRPFVSLERNRDGAAVRYILRWVEVATELERITPAEREQWLDALEGETQRGGFLVGVTHFFVWGTRP